MTDVATAIVAAATPSATAPPPSPATRAPAQAASPASRPGAIDDRHFDGLSAAEQADYARVKKPGENGGAEWVHRDQLSKEPTPASAASGDPAAKPATTITEDGRLKVGDLLLSDQDITGLMERHALEQSRKAGMPASAAEYSLDLPSDFAMPEGQSFKWATDHPVQGPLIGLAKQFAHEHGLDQAAFSKMMGLYAASQVHEAQLIAKAGAAEVAKLGPNAPVRVDSVMQFIRGSIGDDKLARAITQQLLTADQIVGFERLIRKVTNQGAASFSQAHREPDGQPGRVSAAEYDAMSGAERWDYARQFDQKQFQR